MKKTLNINLSGLAFTIDEDAYQALKSYLDTLRRHFNNSEGSDEIMDDIEARIAELMQEKLSDAKTVIGLSDIEEITSQMGSTQDYMEEDSFTSESSFHNSSSASSKMKKLYRDGDNAILGGVCAGIAHYFGIQPLWVRLGLIAAFLTWGFGLLVYLIFWIIVPKAKTTAEKLEMTGEPINVSNIGKRVEEELKDVNQKMKSGDTFNNLGSSLAGFIENIGHLVVRIVTLALKAFGKVLGAMLLLMGSIFTFVLIILFVAMLSTGTFINIGGDSSYSFYEMSNLIFASQFQSYLVLIGGFLISIIPVLAILYGGISLVSGYKNIPRGLGWGLAGTWLLGLIILAYGGISVGNDFSKPATVQESHSIEYESDTLFLTLNEAALQELRGSTNRRDYDMDFHYDQENGVVSIDDLELNIEKSNNDKFMILIDKSARGDSFEEAKNRSTGIMYQFKETDNTISFDPFISFQGVDKWRSQTLQLTLLVPEGKTVYLEKSIKNLIYDIDNVTNTYDGYMVGHYWTMTKNGLESPDFNSKQEEITTEDEDGSIEINIDDTHVEIDM